MKISYASAVDWETCSRGRLGGLTGDYAPVSIIVRLGALHGYNPTDHEAPPTYGSTIPPRECEHLVNPIRLMHVPVHRLVDR